MRTHAAPVILVFLAVILTLASVYYFQCCYMEPPSFVFIMPASKEELHPDKEAEQALTHILKDQNEYTLDTSLLARDNAPCWKTIRLSFINKRLAELAWVVSAYSKTDAALAAKLLMVSILRRERPGEYDGVDYGRHAEKRICRQILKHYPNTPEAELAKVYLIRDEAWRNGRTDQISAALGPAQQLDCKHPDLIPFLRCAGLTDGFHESLIGLMKAIERNNGAGKK